MPNRESILLRLINDLEMTNRKIINLTRQSEILDLAFAQQDLIHGAADRYLVEQRAELEERERGKETT